MSDGEKLERMSRQITEIHTALFGVNGHGGLHRWVEELNKRVDGLSRFRSQLIGYCVGASAVVSIVGWVVANILSK